MEQVKGTKTAARTTFIYDLFRSPFSGILEAGVTTFTLLITIQVFNPEPFYRALIPASMPLGFILSPLFIFLISRVSARSTQWAALLFLACGGFMLISTQMQEVRPFVIFMMLSMFCLAMVPTLMISTYAHNYKPDERGKRMSTIFIFSSLIGGTGAYVGGYFLDQDILLYRWVIVGLAVSAIISAFLVVRVPSPRVTPQSAGNPWENISLLWKDKLFGWIMVAWMFMGVGNLMTIPLRIEYMASEKYGINASNEAITLILVGIPSLCGLASTRIWGSLFDRLNLLVVRSILNTLFLISIVLFFNTQNLYLMGLSGALAGFARGGGSILWMLWVTKIAPPEKTSAYMSIHTSATGIRGVAAPFLGYALIGWWGASNVGWFAGFLILISLFINIPMRNDPRLRGVLDSN